MSWQSMDALTWVRLLGLVLLMAAVPLAWIWARRPQASRAQRLAALTSLTLFLTFDLIVFGAFTRLSDSGLGCPDWPGCYGEVSPLAAKADIHAAQAAQPTGPVTWGKAWIEMIHRYLAMLVGALILVMTALSWLERRRLQLSPWWATSTLIWVLIQGLFGKYTVVLKLYPAIVTLHLLGGVVLLALLVRQREAYVGTPWPVSSRLKPWIPITLAAVLVQMALGGWVSTNYAVLACQGFPTCNGHWWPPMDLGAGFEIFRELGKTAQGDYLPVGALVGIHWVHRLFALVVVALVVGLSAALVSTASTRQWAWLLLGLLLWQVASGMANVVLQWPLLAALMHTAGAAALVGALTLLWVRSRATSSALPSQVPVGPSAQQSA
ncbi:MAG: heme A synthase [Ideonella sp. MAG2]|nr:MAG: heme A synthase [Ideonella sp. MAG2]